MKIPYLCVFIESFQQGRWKAMGVWREGPKGKYMPRPVYLNKSDDTRTTLLGLFHPDYASWRAHGAPELPVITSVPNNLSPEVKAFCDARAGGLAFSWALLSEVQEYPWDKPCEQVFHLSEQGAFWFDNVGVPREEDLEAPMSIRTEVRRQSITAEELWGTGWLQRTLPMLQSCAPEDRVIFALLQEYIVR